ncbi:imm11 family protein [Microbulbifer sp. JMSA003]|uniref:imm11 family protein n=1 Tax=Microbulbifer sp. JMSA003 TaxID=3243369 RepID=UPI004039FBD6
MPGSVTRDDDLISAIEFDEDKLKEIPVFRTKESSVSIYCAEAFKEMVEASSLDGLFFSKNLTQY